MQAPRLFRTLAFLAGVLALTASPTPSSANSVTAQITSQISAMADGLGAADLGMTAAEARFVAALYEKRGFAPIWDSGQRRDDLARELQDSVRHGFRPEDFEIEKLIALRTIAENGDPADVARLDIAATGAAAQLLHHIYYGKVDPSTLDPDWSFKRALQPGNPVGLVDQYLDVATLGALIDDVEVTHPVYVAMQEALLRHLEIAANGGWPAVPDGDVLKPDMEDARVPILRERLAVSGDFAGSGAGEIYDAALVSAVEAFQTRHGLEADGVIGPKTLQALNRTVEHRIDQLRVSLERARWTLRSLGDDFVFVNIGGAETILVQGGEVAWRTRSIVGKAYRKTPVFQDEIQYMEFNPTWTVPRSIMTKDKLPLIRKDPGYLARGNYSVVNANGERISPSQVNWGANNPPVKLVQQPGPKNALGLVKFMFPNDYAVYLHDTDDRSLFDRAERNLSSGCVRIENPFEFADLLMKDDPSWSAARRDEIIASGRTTRIDLPSPIPVLLTYYTAWVDFQGRMQFREDIYERDGPILNALNSQFGA